MSVLGPAPFARDLPAPPAQARGWKPTGAPPGTSAAVGHPRKRARGARARSPVFKGASSLLSSFLSTCLRATSASRPTPGKTCRAWGPSLRSPAGGPVCAGGKEGPLRFSEGARPCDASTSGVRPPESETGHLRSEAPTRGLRSGGLDTRTPQLLRVC